jgi:hypothetical protein
MVLDMVMVLNLVRDSASFMRDNGRMVNATVRGPST